MKLNNIFKLQKEAYKLLIEGSHRTIPFNVLVATLLAIDLLYNDLSPFRVIIWWLCIVFVSLGRWLHNKKLIKQKQQEANETAYYNVLKFFLSTLLIGVVWSSCYLLLLPFLGDLQEFIIILVFGGMCAGAIASLSVYMPAYYAYIFPMFLPIII